MTDIPTYHSFIADESQVREFFRQHIAPYHDESYLNFIIIPIARRKYWPSLSKSQMNLSTKVFSASDTSEDRFVNELRRYEVKCGLYKDTFTPKKMKDDQLVKDQDIPSEAIAFYLTANPMNDLKAFFLMQREVSEKLESIVFAKNGTGRNTADKQIGQISSIYKSCLHKSDQKIFLKLDVDTKELIKIESLRKFMREHSIKPHLVVESRGGYHVLLKRSTIGKNHEKLYRFIQSTLKGIPKIPPNNISHSTLNSNIGIEDLPDIESVESGESVESVENVENVENVEVVRDDEKWITIEKNALVIIPGTWQGGFIARIVNFD